MYIRMKGLYGFDDCSAWYRKQGSGCFDFVNDKKYASDMTEDECKTVMEHAAWYCGQYNADHLEMED